MELQFHPDPVRTIAVCTVKKPDDGQMNCPKQVEFHSVIKF